jgi:hypothetical protein
MVRVIQLQDDKHIQLGAIKEGPEYSIPFITMLGLVYMNWGRLEQTLEFILRFLDDGRLVTGPLPRFPDTSFRLKTKLFKEFFARHPRFIDFHEDARSIAIGLRKANKQRVKMVHSNFQGFKDGPPPTMEVTIAKFNGADLMTFDGSWSLQAILDFNELLCLLNDDLAKIGERVINPEFLRSLERPLSRTESAILLVRRLLSRLPRLRIERPYPLI